jgi:uncharacterized protein DUF3987
VSLRSQTVASPATDSGGGEVSQLSLSQPEAFPWEDLPERVTLLVAEAAEALGVDLALIAGACLAVLAGCIGNRRRIVLKPGWSEPCVLWIAIVMPSGSKKTPAINSVLDHLHRLEAAALAEYREMIEAWKALSKDNREEKPEPPIRLLVSDITTEGLVSIHASAPLGLLVHRDELGGWFRGFDQYKGGKGADAQTWTEMYQGNPCIIDRKTSETLSVPRAAASIVGGVQPELLRSALSGEHLYDGVASRFLFIAVPERPNRWNEETISAEALEGWAGLVNELLALQPNKDGTPKDLPLTAGAKAVWVRYHDEHAARESQEEGPMRAAMSKLKGVTARLALVIQLAIDPQSFKVDMAAMDAAIKISKWFEGQARRIYQGLEETAQERDRRAVYDWIMSRGGSTTQRDLANRGPNRFRKRAEEVLKDLVTAGLAERLPQPGNKGDVYKLCDSCDSCDTCGNGPE